MTHRSEQTASGTREAVLRELVAQAATRPPSISGPIPEEMIRRALANPAMFTGPAELERYQRAVDGYSEAKLKQLAAEFVKAGMWQVPTPVLDAGVSMMAGFDSGGSAGWNIPGFSIHQEFDLLAEAGLSPLEAMRQKVEEHVATVTPRSTGPSCC